MFNEYRIRDSISGREAQAATGVRQTWAISENLKVNAGFETTKAFNGLANNNSTAIVTSAEFFPTDTVHTTAGFEIRKASTTSTFLNVFALSYKINADWSFLGRSIFNHAENKTGGTAVQTRQQLGFAYREVEQNIWNALALYEHRYESVSGLTSENMGQAGMVTGFGNNLDDGLGYTGNIKADTHIVSIHVNYQANADLIITGHYAGKIKTVDYAGVDSMYWAQLLYGRATWDFMPKWDASVQSGVYVGMGGAVQYAVGAELGYQLMNNLWVSVGYNFTGINDPDLTANQYINQGVYGRIRYKFDENTLSNLKL
jgi:hypothetical protein